MRYYNTLNVSQHIFLKEFLRHILFRNKHYCKNQNIKFDTETTYEIKKKIETLSEKKLRINFLTKNIFSS